MDFQEALDRRGFGLAEQRAGGEVLYQAKPNRFLTYWVHASPDGTALFTWEFAVVDYLATRRIQIGSGEALNTFMFPVEDDRGIQDGAWLASAVDRTEALLASLRFDDPER